MDNEEKLIIARPHFIFIIGGWWVVICISLYLLFYYPGFIASFNVWKLLFGILLVMIDVYMVISNIRMRIAVTNEYVEYSNIITKRIYYANIDRIEIDSYKGITIISGKDKIHISRGISSYARVIRCLADKLADISFKNIKGDKKLIKKYFNSEKSR